MEDQKNQQAEESVVEVPEIKVEQEEVKLDIENMIPEEVALAKKHGLIKEEPKKDKVDGTDTKPPVVETKDSKEEVEEEVLDPQSFEDMDAVFEKDESKFHKKFTPNAKALYFQNKRNKKLRQEALQELEEVKANYELTSVKSTVAQKKVEKINALLSGDPDKITVEAITEILNAQKLEDNDDNTPLTRAEMKRMQDEQTKKATEQEKAQKDFNDRLLAIEGVGKSQFTDFDAITKLAQEVIESDPDGLYKDILQRSFSDKSIDEAKVVNRIVSIAQLSPKYKELEKASAQAEKKNDGIVDRAIKNSKKTPSSASINGSGGRIVKNEDDLTVEEASRLSTAQWAKLKKETKQRILMGIDP